MKSTGALASTAARLRKLTGARRAAAAFGLGALASAAMPPVHLIPVLWLALPGLVWLSDGTRGPRGAFLIGWWFGLGHFAAGLYWIAHALLTEPEKYAWMIPFAVLGLAAVLAVFIGLATALARLAGTFGPARVLALAGAWGLGEWLRTWVFTGFPWNLMGTVWAPLPSMLQGAAVVGALGLGVATVAVAAMPAVLADPGTRRGRLLPVVAAHAVLAVLWAGGAARLASAPAVGDIPADAPVVRIVQANIAQSHKWRDDLRERHLLRHIQLSRAPGHEAVDAVIWPETAAPFFLDHDAEHRAMVAAAAPPGGVVITGAPRATPPDHDPFQVWNSLQAVDGRGRILASYDKAHLVPFGEYVPFRDLLPLEKITPGGTDFTAGPGPRTLAVAGLPPFSPLICYEAIFPGAVVGPGPRPAFLLNVTNDGWFGISAGPHQHLAAARMRAVEEGLPLVRAANTGISVVVDGLGRTVARLPLGEQGVLDSPLPPPLGGTTFYSRHPWAAPLAVMLGLLFPSYLLRRCNRRFQ